MTVLDSGTQTATTGTQHTLSTSTSTGVFVLVVDAGNLANGETLTLKILTKCLSGGTEQTAYTAIYQHAQGEPMKYSVPVPSDVSYKVTLQQDGGTGHTFPWKIYAL